MKLQQILNKMMGVEFEVGVLPEEPEIEPPQALYEVEELYVGEASVKMRRRKHARKRLGVTPQE